MDSKYIINTMTDNNGIYNGYYIIRIRKAINNIDRIFSFADKIKIMSVAIVIGAIVYSIVTL